MSQPFYQFKHQGDSRRGAAIYGLTRYKFIGQPRNDYLGHVVEDPNFQHHVTTPQTLRYLYDVRKLIHPPKNRISALT
jgi:hypothetical protein